MYDYVIIGAGTAGCVLANRLSADPRASVLLLEAGGPDDRRDIRVPLAFSKLFRGPFDWNEHTEPQKHLANRRLYWPRGKGLGGSSTINAMIYIRGHAHDYDHWAALGNAGWGYEDVLDYFKKSEDQERGACPYHGVGGPLHVCDARSPHVLSRAFLSATRELGWVPNSDFNGRSQEGAGFYQLTQHRGKRHSVADAYLKPVRARANLTVGTDAQVIRIVCDGGRATGVEFVEKGARRRVGADREILLCAGAVRSPHLLLLSGIGARSQLQGYDIPVVLDLPGVGENLQDHLALPIAYACTQPITLACAGSLWHLLSFLLLGRGPLTSNVAEAGAFVKSSPGLDAPDLQFLFGPVFFLDHGRVQPKDHGFTLGPTLLRPQSKGRITLRSNDPFAAPAIEPDYLSAEHDLHLLVEGTRLARQLAAARAFDAFRGPEVLPGPAIKSEQEIAGYVRQHAETLYHPVGTCKMGTDASAVVDGELRVRGIRGLRVVDASIMPTIPGGNTNAPVLMIAEKAADFIVKETAR
jgi:choline dehydrogenase